MSATPVFGNLGSRMTQANTWVPVYTVQSLANGILGATIGFNILNQQPSNNNNGVSNIQIALSMANNPGPQDIITILQMSLNYRYTNNVIIPMSPGETFYVFCDNANVSVRVHGVENALPPI